MKKGTIEEDHIPVNKFELWPLAAVPINFTTISGLEEELDTVELPDRTVASGGRTSPIEFTAATPLHHTAQLAAMQLWYEEGQDPVTPTYKKPATLISHSLTGKIIRTYIFPDLFVSKRGESDKDAANEGEMATVTWTLKASSVLWI